LAQTTNADVMAGEYRPQWTPRTTAGRAKLRVDDNNWEYAERHRQQREERENYTAEFRNHVQLTNSYEAAVKREERLSALQHSREATSQQIVEQGKQIKSESEQLRAVARQQRQQWEDYGRFLTGFHTNVGARRARRLVEDEKVDEAEVRRRQRESHRHERAYEVSQRVLANREKAQRARTELSLSMRSVSAAELHSRHQVAQWMRQAERVRDGERGAEKRQVLETAKQSHDAVLENSSRGKVVGYLEADRRRRAATAAAQRAQLRSMSHVRAAEHYDEISRRRAMHDAVRHAELHGYEYPADALGQPLSPEVRWLSPETARDTRPGNSPLRLQRASSSPRLRDTGSPRRAPPPHTASHRAHAPSAAWHGGHDDDDDDHYDYYDRRPGARASAPRQRHSTAHARAAVFRGGGRGGGGRGGGGGGGGGGYDDDESSWDPDAYEHGDNSGFYEPHGTYSPGRHPEAFHAPASARASVRAIEQHDALYWEDERGQSSRRYVL
jgi:hypothetical protein